MEDTKAKQDGDGKSNASKKMKKRAGSGHACTFKRLGFLYGFRVWRMRQMIERFGCRSKREEAEESGSILASQNHPAKAQERDSFEIILVRELNQSKLGF